VDFYLSPSFLFARIVLEEVLSDFCCKSHTCQRVSFNLKSTQPGRLGTGLDISVSLLRRVLTGISSRNCASYSMYEAQNTTPAKSASAKRFYNSSFSPIVQIKLGSQSDLKPWTFGSNEREERKDDKKRRPIAK
jgi:hypothetical protein